MLNDCIIGANYIAIVLTLMKEEKNKFVLAIAEFSKISSMDNTRT